ncbi:zinc finger protein ZFAT-like isoform X2 [Tubulanus polymorphus]
MNSLISKPAVSNRKRGRPRKVKDSDTKPSVPVIQKQAEQQLPLILENGKISCRKCKKSFLKERHFKTHRCLAGIDYVDEAMCDSDNDSVVAAAAAAAASAGENDNVDEIEDEDGDFRLKSERPLKKQKRTRYPIHRGSTDRKDDADSIGENHHDVEPSPAVTIELSNGLESIPDDPASLLENSVIPRVSEAPTFATDDEKRRFDDSLNVEISSFEHMFRVHKIEQDLNETTSVQTSRGSQELTIYSCNTCNKVFKSLSHIRHHCLTHTDLKPFKCTKCSYTSNSKGNLYTHMRKHTGQFYRCKSCDFKSVNRSHVIDHESIHNAERHRCEICQNDYSTLKSLINHVRKYHGSNQRGVDYLQQFLSRQTASSAGAVLHQCHVCNRKFKKKIDRDRHLFVHKLSVRQTMYKCEVCDYSSHRRRYLEYHMQKHRIIYCCAICSLRFASAAQLNQHLDEFHLSENCPQPSDERIRSNLFDSCINASLFLPEPDGTIDLLATDQPSLLEENCSLLEKLPPETSDNCASEETTTLLKDSTRSLSDVVATVDESEQLRSILRGAADETDILIEASADSDRRTTEDETIDERTQMFSYDIYEKLNYHLLNTDLLNKIKEMFGDKECQYCGRLFNHLTDLQPHLFTHTGDKPFPCDKCDYHAVNKGTLMRHIEKYHEYIQYSCTEEACSFTAIGRYQLWVHLQKHKSSKSDCPVCKTRFTDKQMLNVHISTQHPDFNRDEVQRSINISRRVNRCPNCDRVFVAQNGTDVQKHVCTREAKKTFRCELCRHTSSNINNLKIHMLRHYNTKLLQCDYCDKKYKSKTALRCHIRTHKNGGRIFKCTKCPYNAEQKSQLVKHMTRHEVLKQYRCEKCEFSTNALGAIRTHNNRYHNNTATALTTTTTEQLDSFKMFKCLSCDSLFENVELIHHHLRDAHLLEVEDIRVFESCDNVMVSAEGSATTTLSDNAETQVVQLNISNNQPSIESTASLESLQFNEGEMNAKPVSTINILQQIIAQQQELLEAQQGDSISLQQTGGASLNPAETIVIKQQQEQQTAGVEQATQFVIQCSASEEAAELFKQVEQAMNADS